ncbi:lysozyme inhibitor LprI family protein [Cerasicoccus maritimus]|uniref:lysozyme inhibitor LprI family protein n=1 Tax=Cerasicoccus maritimus TaxID=490089 RepID=UPI0028527947|nr:lysozyme inhibitor LprI family protein [Cerasicoccus maritimus]
MAINIGETSKDWWAQMEATYKELLDSLKHDDARRLEISQKAWELAYEADRQFFFADRELRFKIGREGEILSQLEFMRRIRKRALDLAEYQVIFAAPKSAKAQ